MSDLATVTPGNTVTRLVGKVTLIESDDTTVARRLGVITGFNADGTVQLQLAASGINITPVQLMRGVQVGVGDSVWVDMKGTDPLVIGHSSTPLPPIGLEPYNEIGVGTNPAFGNGWVNFGSGLETAAYYKDPDGFVHLKGVIKSGTLGTAAFILPVAYRPLEAHIFSTQQNNNIGSVTIPVSGGITPFTNATFVSLNGISFPTVKDSALWIPAHLAGWSPDWTTNGNTGALPAFYVRDDGLVFMKGGIKSGTANAEVGIIPELARPAVRALLTSMSNGAYTRIDMNSGMTWGQITGGSNVWQQLSGFAWWNARAEDYPWTALPLSNSWADFGGVANDPSWPAVSYLKDKYGVVHIRGLVKNGTATSGLTIGTLPAGYRPALTAVVNSSCGGSGQTARFDITNTGLVTFQIGINGFFSLYCRFRAEV